jgi:hypothetical protein
MIAYGAEEGFWAPGSAGVARWHDLGLQVYQCLDSRGGEEAWQGEVGTTTQCVPLLVRAGFKVRTSASLAVRDCGDAQELGSASCSGRLKPVEVLSNPAMGDSQSS